jgi:hypothetical protein
VGEVALADCRDLVDRFATVRLVNRALLAVRTGSCAESGGGR